MPRPSVVDAVPNRLRRLLAVAAALLMLPALTVLVGSTPNANATFVFPPAGNHAWPYCGQQLTSLKPDLIATLNG
jgi:hypothetical protein